MGTEPKTHIAYKVLEHTIRKHTSRPVEITPMIGPAWEYPIDDIKVGTGFSLRRWMIPLACDWDGHAIYMDADQIVFGDVGELFDLGRSRLPCQSESPVVACTFQPDKYSKEPWPQTSVMVIDCRRAFSNWQFKINGVLGWLRQNRGNDNYAKLMHAQGMRVADPLPVEWNHLNVYKEGITKLLHYTKEDEQVWYNPKHPLAHLWIKELIECLKEGHVTRADMEHALDQWNKRTDWRRFNGLHPHFRKYLVSAVK